MTRRAATLLLCLAACGCGSSGPDADQQAVLQAIAAGQAESFCLQPLLRGEAGAIPARMEMAGFEDLAAAAGPPDVRLQSGAQLGGVRIADDPACVGALVPRVSGDRAVAAFFLPDRLEEFGLRRAGARWTVVSRGTTDR